MRNILLCLALFLIVPSSISFVVNERNNSTLIAELLSFSLNNTVTSSVSKSSSDAEAPFKNPTTLFGQPSLLKFADCAELLKSGYNKSGIYTIWPRSRVTHCSLDVYCDMDTSGGGWTVIQRRGKFGGPMNAFNQNWESYKDGFGTLNEEFWLGNNNIHALTNQGHYTVRFDLQQKNKGRAYALYDKFWIDNEDQKYKLHISGYSGDAGDSMAYHNGMFFSTKDRDNDRSDAYHCAKDRSSGWWFNYCMESNLNGLYRDGAYTAAFNDGIEWHTFGGNKNSLIATEIKIRPSNKACKRHSSLAPSKIKIP